MEILNKKHLKQISEITEKMEMKTFYHYPPLILAMSESLDEKFQIDNRGRIWADIDNRELFLSLNLLPSFDINMIHVSSIPSQYPSIFSTVLYDKNYIYDLETTSEIKNVKANVKKFDKNCQCKIISVVPKAKEPLTIIRKWYEQRKSQEFTDFGYTIWLIQHHHEFPDIHTDLMIIDNKPVAFSLWGELDSDTAIHIISKDTRQYPYIQEKLRMKVYNDMMLEGYKMVNDGSNCGIYELRRFKDKLRPYFIIPVWSWVRKEGV